MTSIIEARDAYEDALKTYQPLIDLGVKTFTHGGSFTQEELDRYSEQTPGVVLTLLSFEMGNVEGVLKAETHWGVMIYAEEKPGGGARNPNSRDRVAVMIAQMVSSALLTNYVGVDDELLPQGISCRNRFDTRLDKDGVAMWSVEFSSEFVLTDPNFESVPLQTIHAEWDLAPRDGDPTPDLAEIIEAEDEIDLS